MRFGSPMSTNTTYHQAMVDFSEELTKISGGKLKVDLFPNAQLGGHKFKYKAVVGSAIVDFLVPTRKLAVEIDAGTQGDPEVEERRTRKLAGLGLTVVRVSADDVARNLDGVLRHIFEAIQARRPAR